MTVTAWSMMMARENIETRARLARTAAGRARAEGREDAAQVQERILTRIAGEAEAIADQQRGE